MKYYSLFIACFVCLTSHASEQQSRCKVIAISDGDTLTCLFKRKQIKIRLAHIDAPESSQPYGNKAKQTLAHLTFKQDVLLKSMGYDHYQRLLAVLYSDKGENINLKLVQQGMAWAYSKTDTQYEYAQQKAQKDKTGLWRENHPIPPSTWRKQNPFNPVQADEYHENFTHSSKIHCHTKLYCSQISDYDLALHYFHQCGWKELDGNNDGIPCNKLYRKVKPNRK